MILLTIILLCAFYIFDRGFLGRLFGLKDAKEEEADEYGSLRHHLRGNYDIIINYDIPNNEYEIWGSLIVYKLTERPEKGRTATKKIYERNDWIHSYKSPPQSTLIKANVKASVSAEVKSMVKDILSEKTQQKPRHILINSPGGEGSEVIVVEQPMPDGGPGQPSRPADESLYAGDV